MKPRSQAIGPRTIAHGYLRGLPVPELHEEEDDDALSADGNVTQPQRLRSPQLIGERAHRFHFLDVREVDYLQVNGNYVTIHVGEDRYLTRATLKHLSDVLAPYDFVRIDRSALINLQQVDYVERLKSGQFAFQLRHGQHLISSRQRSVAIVRLLRGGVR